MKFRVNFLCFFIICLSIAACSKKSNDRVSIKSPQAKLERKRKLDSIALIERLEMESKFPASFKFNFSKKKSMNLVMNEAISSKKLIYLDVSASWCVPCQLMKRDVYTHDDTADFFNKNYVSHLVDIEKEEGPDIKLIYNITKIPTLLIVDEKGKEIARHEGALTQSGLVIWAKANCQGKCL